MAVGLIKGLKVTKNVSGPRHSGHHRHLPKHSKFLQDRIQAACSFAQLNRRALELLKLRKRGSWRSSRKGWGFTSVPRGTEGNWTSSLRWWGRQQPRRTEPPSLCNKAFSATRCSCTVGEEVTSGPSPGTPSWSSVVRGMVVGTERSGRQRQYWKCYLIMIK